jgi:hypothetical protein
LDKQERFSMYADHAYADRAPTDFRRLAQIALVVALLAFIAGFAYWRMTHPKIGSFGSVAISATSQDYGASWGYPDALSAYKRALEECNGRVGAKDCTVRMSLNKNCGALVMSQSHNLTFAVTDTDKTQASAFAVAQCQASGASDCVLKENFCGGNS